MNTEPKTHEETVAEILGRYSVADLVEQTPEDMERGAKNYGGEMSIEDEGKANLIRWFKVKSGGKHYTVRRFQSFFWCSCPSFFFRQGKACKHCVFVARSVDCENCGIMPAEKGQLCIGCYQNRAAKLAA